MDDQKKQIVFYQRTNYDDIISYKIIKLTNVIGYDIGQSFTKEEFENEFGHLVGVDIVIR
jgi:hypothetical protein